MSAAERVASMSPDELIAVIERGLEADERAALAASSASTPPWRVTSEQDDFDGDVLVGFTVLRDADGEEIANDRGDFTEEELRHFARHDPSRVLADVQAKREILALHPHTTQRQSVGERHLAAMYGRNWEKRLKNLDTPYCLNCHVEDGVIGGGGSCATLIALARPYLDQETP